MNTLELTDKELSQLSYALSDWHSNHLLTRHSDSYHSMRDKVKDSVSVMRYKDESDEPKNIIVTLREIVQSDVLLDHFGYDPYCINEGANPEEEHRITKSLAKKANII